jgi:hypothetical protein
VRHRKLCVYLKQLSLTILKEKPSHAFFWTLDFDNCFVQFFFGFDNFYCGNYKWVMCIRRTHLSTQKWYDSYYFTLNDNKPSHSFFSFLTQTAPFSSFYSCTGFFFINSATSHPRKKFHSHFLLQIPAVKPQPSSTR